MSIEQAVKKYASLNSQLESVEAQIKTLTEQRREIEAQMDELNMSLRDGMIGAGLRKAVIDGWRLNISSAVSTIVEETDNLPERFWRIERKPDLMKIKEALRTGEQVEGARLVQKQNLSLKQIG